jgi:hypothetical protein
MPSVIAHWRGTCPFDNKKLCAHPVIAVSLVSAAYDYLDA